MIYNLDGNKFNNILSLLKRNLPHHPTLLFIEHLEYLNKDSEKLHILLFLEFSKKTIDNFFEKMQQNRNILQFFIQEKNVYFINYLNYCIALFRDLKTLNFIVKSAVLDQYNIFLTELDKLMTNSLQTQRMGFSTRNNKRSSTPNLILSILDHKYQWKINTKNLSISPCGSSQERRQFFNNDHYHKKKNSSFENKIRTKSINISFNENNDNNGGLHKKKIISAKMKKIAIHVLKKRLLLKHFKETNEMLRKLNENLTEEVQNLHSDIKNMLKDQEDSICDAKQQSKDDLEKKIIQNYDSKNQLIKIPLQSSEVSINLPMNSMADSKEDHHTKKTSRTNKLSFGQKSLSHEKFDSFHNMSTVSPKFEGTIESNKTFHGLVTNHFNLELNLKKNQEKALSSSPMINETDSSYFEETKTLMTNSQILFKEKYENLFNRSYKPKPLKKISVNIIYSNVSYK